MSQSQPKLELCEVCHEREATVFPMVVRGGKHTFAHFCGQCYQSSREVPRSLQDLIADLEGKPRKEGQDEQ
jgi:protein-arginine kinase activator protein McsA